jgi:hypothetical protein
MLAQPDQPQKQQPPEQQLPELQPQPENKSKRTFIIVGVAVFIVILAGAAFLAGSLMNKKNTDQNGPLTQIQGSSNGGPVTMKKTINKNYIIPAKELPTVQADVRGLFVSRTGNSIIIGTGQVTIGIMKNDSSGAVTPQASYDGPTYEVVVTKDTLVYKDTTAIDFSASSNTPVQQTVAIGSLDDLNGTTTISVWGKKTGDRYVADVIVYSSPLIKMNGGTGGTNK